VFENGNWTDAIWSGFWFTFDIQGEEMAELLTVCLRMVPCIVETSAIETGQAHVDAERLVLGCA
jgi:hypothetical protein